MVTINVLRNLFAPVFVENSYEVTIFETRDLGSSFLTVRATDADNRVSAQCIAPAKKLKFYLKN